MPKQTWALVLLVDDHPDILRTVPVLLARVGLETVTAASGPAGLAALEQRIPQLVLLDNDMPGMRGLRVLHLMKEDPRFRHIPVICISGDATHNFLAEAQRLGIADLVPKPFESIVLLRAVLKALGRPCAPDATLASLIEEYAAKG
jgi:CheY-like chemotaxis protein